ncbi:hypothetical protein [Urechidicola sp. KH5]
MQLSIQLQNTIVRLSLFLNLIMLFTSSQLWINTKSLPIFPLIDEQWLLPVTLELPFIIAYGMLHVIAIIKPKKIWVGIIILMYILLVLNDQNRLVIYHYQVMLTLFLFVLNAPIHFYKVLFIGIYFWGGLHKFNSCFYDYFTNIYLFGAPKILKIIIAIGIPLIETIFAIGLAFNKTKKYAFKGLFTMHIIILFLVFFKFKSYNIIPWNIINCFILLFLFYKDHKIQEIKEKSNNTLVLLLLVITMVFGPLLNKAELWDDFLAFKMYTYDVNQFYFNVSDKVKNYLPQEIQENYRIDQNGNTIFYLYDWFYKINKIPVYPEERNIIYIENYLTEFLPTETKFKEELILKNYRYCE